MNRDKDQIACIESANEEDATISSNPGLIGNKFEGAVESGCNFKEAETRVHPACFEVLSCVADKVPDEPAHSHCD